MLIHPLAVRITHWVNAIAMLIMIASGWRIYNAAPFFSFTIPPQLTLGGWLGGALQWHFAGLWLLVINGVIYLSYGLASRHIAANFFPLTLAAIWRDLRSALRGRIAHEVGVYNALQRMAYLGVICAVIALVFSGAALWKPVQLQELAALIGGYEGVRRVHFVAMALVVAFVIVHLVMVVLVPRTLISMFSGYGRKTQLSRDTHHG